MEYNNESPQDGETPPVEEIIGQELSTDTSIPSPNTETPKPTNLASSPPTAPIPVKKSWLKRLKGVNPYLFLFGLVVIIGLIVAVIVTRTSRQNNPNNITFEGSELDQETLDALLGSEQNIGTVDETLTVAANAIFNGQVLVKSNLDVAGTIRVGGPLSLPGITVAGTSKFEEVNVSNNLAILGSASIQDSLTVRGGANITGNVSVGGTLSAGAISADSVEFNGNLKLTRHIDTGGSTPSASRGSAAGSGGTVSVSGNDTAGTVTVNTGGGASAGTLVSVEFALAFNATPIVNITPVGSATGSLNYYVTRTTSGFTIGATGSVSSSTTFKFDYFIVE